MKKPLVSVLMPAYNCEKYIGESIESVLKQTLKEFELVIVDDGSDDSTPAIIREYMEKDGRIRYFRLEHGGICKALNYGLEQCSGDFVARMDADDVMYDGRLEIQYWQLHDNPSIAAISGSIHICDMEMNHLVFQIKKRVPVTFEIIENECPLIHPCTMMRKSELDKLGVVYDPEWNYCEDYELWFRMLTHGMVLARTEDILLKYRYNPKSVSNTPNSITVKLSDKIHQMAHDVVSEMKRKSGKINFGI